MKHTSSLLLGLVFAVLIAVPQIVLGQTPELPDYSQWQVSGADVATEATLNGRATKLSFTAYVFIDDIGKPSMAVSVVNNENETPWLALYLVESLQPNDPSAFRFYLFEYQNNKWVLVKDLTTASSAEFADVLKSHYNLEFK